MQYLDVVMFGGEFVGVTAGVSGFAQVAKRNYRKFFGFSINLALFAGETTAVCAQPAPPIWPQA